MPANPLKSSLRKNGTTISNRVVVILTKYAGLSIPVVGGKNAALLTASLFRSEVSRNLTRRIGTTISNPVRNVFIILFHTRSDTYGDAIYLIMRHWNYPIILLVAPIKV